MIVRVELSTMLDTVVISGEDVCCSVVFDTLVGVFAFSVMWSELLMTYAISCPLWSVYECHKVECAFTSLLSTTKHYPWQRTQRFWVLP